MPSRINSLIAELRAVKGAPRNVGSDRPDAEMLRRLGRELAASGQLLPASCLSGFATAIEENQKLADQLLRAITAEMRRAREEATRKERSRCEGILDARATLCYDGNRKKAASELDMAVLEIREGKPPRPVKPEKSRKR